MNETLKKIKAVFAVPASVGGNPELLALVDKLDVEIALLEQSHGTLKRLEAEMLKKWEDDHEAPLSKEIHDESPTETGNHDRFMRAYELVTPRQGKYELIFMVNWILARAEKAEAKVKELQTAFRMEHLVSVYFGVAFPETVSVAFNALGWLSQTFPQSKTVGDALIRIADTLKARDDWKKAYELATASPIPMVLHCPSCGFQHIDKDEWATKVHRSHKCSSCSLIWRVADVPTVGVEAVKTASKDDMTIHRRFIPAVVSGHEVMLRCVQPGCNRISPFKLDEADMDRGFFRCPTCGYPSQ